LVTSNLITCCVDQTCHLVTCHLITCRVDHLPLWSHLPPATCYLPPATCRLPFATLITLATCHVDYNWHFDYTSHFALGTFSIHPDSSKKRDSDSEISNQTSIEKWLSGGVSPPPPVKDRWVRGCMYGWIRHSARPCS
jgi:hypothetical protein